MIPTALAGLMALAALTVVCSKSPAIEEPGHGESESLAALGVGFGIAGRSPFLRLNDWNRTNRTGLSRAGNEVDDLESSNNHYNVFKGGLGSSVDQAAHAPGWFLTR